MKNRRHGASSADCEAGDSEFNDNEARPLLASKSSKGVAGTGEFKGTAGSFSLQLLNEQFGHRLLVILFTSQHLMKGFAASFTGPCVSFLYRSYNIPGPEMQIFGGVTQLPWAMKPIIGLISDAMPIMGYHKAPYMFLVTFCGVAACATIGVVPQAHLSVHHLVGCIFMMQLQFSTCDLLTEAKYAEQIKSKPEHGPALMTYVWFGLNVGGLVATAAVGPVMQHWGTKVPFILAILPASFIMVPLMKNYLEEVPKSREQMAAARKQLMDQKEACFLCFLMFVGTLLLTYIGIMFESATVNAVAALVVALVMLVSFSVVLRPIIAKVNAFFLIQTSLGFSIGGASFYFYTDTEEQYFDGPHFTQEFFTSVLGVASSICALVGVYTYQRFASEWTYRKLIYLTNIALSIFSLTDVFFFLRLNKHVYIPDKAFVLGASVLQTVIGQWMWMPGVVILSQLCPAGMEATMYALLAGCHNLGNTIAANCGALVLEWLHCQPSGAAGEQEQFKYLWVGALLSTVMPMFTLLLVRWMIPDAKQTDKLLEPEDRDACEGSLLRQWQGRR